MHVAHFAPFAPPPMVCGMYEAARDMARSDHSAGRQVSFVDTGIQQRGVRGPIGRVGLVDDRAGWKLETVSWESVLHADLWVLHDGVHNQILMQSEVPMIYMVHGRPAAAFRAEEMGEGPSFSTVNQISKWERMKAVVTMWDEFHPYWGQIVEPEKLRNAVAPVIDRSRFSMDGPVYEIKKELHGRWNLLICDSWRADVNCFEVAMAAACAASADRGLKVHIFNIDPNQQAPWEQIFARLRDLNALGQLVGTHDKMDTVYRAMDVLLTPHTIATRTVLEALSCGCAVVAPKGNCYTRFQGNLNSPQSMAQAIRQATDALTSKGRGLEGECDVALEVCGFDAWQERITPIYEDAVR